MRTTVRMSERFDPGTLAVGRAMIVTNTSKEGSLSPQEQKEAMRTHLQQDVHAATLRDGGFVFLNVLWIDNCLGGS